MMTPWKDPHPGKQIKSIAMESTGRATPILLAITAGDSLEEYNAVKTVLE
jgi:hypothetical protein